MRPAEVGKRVGVFALVVLVVGAALTGPALLPASSGDASALSIESHQPDAILASDAPEDGTVRLDADAPAKTVVVDASHANGFEESDIAPLVASLTAAGHTVQVRERNQRSPTPLNDSLRSADAFVVVDPTRAYTESEKAGIAAFVDGGGRLLLAAEPDSQSSDILSSLLGVTSSTSTAPAPMADLASAFRFSFGQGYLYNLASYDVNYRDVYATPAADRALVDGVSETTVHEAVPVSGGTPLLTTNESTTLSSTRRSGSYAVAARQDDVLALGDLSILSQEWVYRSDNEALAGNVAAFLVTGQKESGVPESPEPQRPRGP
jgi:hypothetical protein